MENTMEWLPQTRQTNQTEPTNQQYHPIAKCNAIVWKVLFTFCIALFYLIITVYYYHLSAVFHARMLRIWLVHFVFGDYKVVSLLCLLHVRSILSFPIALNVCLFCLCVICGVAFFLSFFLPSFALCSSFLFSNFNYFTKQM